MSAIEQPAARSGSTTCWCVGGEDVGRLGHEVDAAEDDVLGLGTGRGVAGQLEGVAGDVGELDDLVALVVVAQHEHPLAQRGLARPGPARPGRGRRRPAGRPGTPPRARTRGRGRGRAAAGGGRRCSCPDPRSAGPGSTGESEQRAGAGRTASAVLHPAQREEAAGPDAEPGRDRRRRPPSRWRRRRAPISTGTGRGRTPPAPPTVSDVAARRLLAASSTGAPTRVDVGVAGAGGRSVTSSRSSAASTLVVGAVRGAAGASVERSPAGRGRRRCRRGRARPPAAPHGRRVPWSDICGCSRNPASA